MSGLDYVTLAALAASWILAIGTLLLMYWQTRQNQHLNSANAVMALRERFDSTQMRRARRTLAGDILRKAHEDITEVEVASFFELVGALTHRRVLDEDLVWEAFGTWIAAYYWALRHPVDLIGRARTSLNDPLIFHEFEWLQDRITRLDEARLGATHAMVAESETQSHGVLRREASLGMD